MQVPPDGVVGSCNFCCHSFAACTVDVTVCFICQTVSALTLEPLTLFCTADTLLIASCLFWSENWLLAYFLSQARWQKLKNMSAEIPAGGFVRIQDSSQV